MTSSIPEQRMDKGPLRGQSTGYCGGKTAIEGVRQASLCGLSHYSLCWGPRAGL